MWNNYGFYNMMHMVRSVTRLYVHQLCSDTDQQYCARILQDENKKELHYKTKTESQTGTLYIWQTRA